jgi:hypothetical protein
MFNGEANADKLNNWIRQIEVYLSCTTDRRGRGEDPVGFSSTGRNTTLVWWESKLQKGSKHNGKLLSSWSEFTSALRNKFYPLGHVQKSMMEWKNLRQGKGQNVQSFTEEFRKKALALNIPLDSPETLMKYIGALHSYIHHTLLLFNPTNLDEVCVQETHLESRGNNVQEDHTKKPSKFQNNKFKGKGKGKKTIYNKERGRKSSCTHCKKYGHDDEHCWKLHPELNQRNLVAKGSRKMLLQCNKT